MRSAPLLALLFLIAWAPGCDSAEDVSTDEVVGDYTATRFEADLGDGPVDVLDLGGSLSIRLQADGNVDGLLVIPEGLAEDGESEVPFGGTFQVSGDRVRFFHEADTFVRDAVWLYANGQLRSQSFSSDIVLER